MAKQWANQRKHEKIEAAKEHYGIEKTVLGSELLLEEQKKQEETIEGFQPTKNHGKNSTHGKIQLDPYITFEQRLAQFEAQHQNKPSSSSG